MTQHIRPYFGRAVIADEAGKSRKKAPEGAEQVNEPVQVRTYELIAMPVKSLSLFQGQGR